MNPVPWLLLAFAAAAATTFCLAVVAERCGRRLGVMDLPRPGEVQRREVPRTGGYAMLVGLWVALLVGVRDALVLPGRSRCRPGWNPADDMRMLGLVIGTICIVPLAVLDDRRRLGPLPQLFGQLLIAVRARRLRAARQQRGAALR